MTNIKATKKALISSVLALVMCFTMLLGTTFAWFTDSVTSAGNIIQSGNLKIGMYWANGSAVVPAVDDAAWNDASEGPIFTSDVLWEPGYVNAKHILIKNEGNLDLNYELRITTQTYLNELANVIDVYYFENATQLTRATVETGTNLGTLAEIMGTNKNISNTVKGSLVVSDDDTTNNTKAITLAFKMQESAGNEYQGLALDNFSVQLIATQLASEKDSFGNNYDENALSPAVPGAVVKAISPKSAFTASILREGETTPVDLTILEEGLVASATMGIGGAADKITLNAAYQFEPSQIFDDMMKSEYKYYIADFVVSADREVPADSIALAGYYDAWCKFNNDNWVAMTANTDIATNTEIRLVEALGAAVHYKDICQYGNDGVGFVCGLADLTGENAGTTVTVKLCLFKTDADPNGSSASTTEVPDAEPIVIGTFTYTFGCSVDENTPVVGSVDGITSAFDTNEVTIKLAAGGYEMPSSSSANTLNIVGTKDTVIDVTKGAYVDNGKVTFDGVTIKTGTGMVNGNGSDYAALYSPDVTYINCTFVGPMRVGRDGAKFINCTFTELGNDYVWTYGNDVTFEGCTFNTDGKAILIYSDGGNEVSKVTVKDCVFNSTQGAKAGAIANQNCAAIEIHNYGNGVDLVTSGNTYDSNFSGEWRIKTYETGKTKVFVNGVEYTTIAIDGKTMTIDANKNVTVNN